MGEQEEFKSVTPHFLAECSHEAVYATQFQEWSHCLLSIYALHVPLFI